MPQLWRAKIVSNQEIAPACFRMVLAGEFENFTINPGQFIMLKISKGYDPLLRRPFAVERIKTRQGFFLQLIYKVIGKGTKIMSRMPPGTEVELLGPLGNGFQIPDKLNTALVIAGGMGIASLRGLIYLIIARKIKTIHLFMGAKSASQLIASAQLQKMKILVHLATEDGSAGFAGMVTEIFDDFLRKYSSISSGSNQTMVFACGPPKMLARVASLCEKYNLPCQASLESRMACGIGACLGCAVKVKKPANHFSTYVRVCQEGPVFNAQEIEW